MCNQLTLNPSRFYTKTPIKIGHQTTLMCANFKPLTLEQLKQQQLPMIDFEYVDEVYPGYSLPLMFKKDGEYQWREVMFGLVPKWATDLTIAKKTYNARSETLLQKASFFEPTTKCQFGVIPVTEFYEAKYIQGKPQRWCVRRKDKKAFFIAALYEICKIDDQVIRSATMITIDAIDHPMMREFHEPGDVKRSVVVIPEERLDQWLSLTIPDIESFIEGFPVEEFECAYVPKLNRTKQTNQLNFFD
jgi:putative SOS response-associated peptidase YedK